MRRRHAGAAFPPPVDAQRHGFRHFVARCLLGMRFDPTVANGMLSVAGVNVTHSGIKGPLSLLLLPNP